MSSDRPSKDDPHQRPRRNPRQRLHPATLHGLAALVARPRYDRAALRAGILHLGVGAFARAHLFAATEAALLATGDLRWGIVGVSLRTPDTRDALAPQAGLYTLALRDAAEDGTPRESLQVIGALIEVLVATDDPAAVLERIAHPDTRILSLTVTEKGYHHDPASGAMRDGDADIAHDLAHPEAPRSTLGFLAHGLRLRMQRRLPPPTLLSCDNLPANGDTLRGLVLAFAQRLDARAPEAPALQASLYDWIAAGCTFPNAMVDRIVPRTSDADRERIALQLGLHDAWPVVAEPFSEWVVEDRFAAGRPAWPEADEIGARSGRAVRTAAGFVRFVERAEPFERLKLRMVNGGHSALAYLGLMAGLNTVHEALAAAPLRRFIAAMMREEIAPSLPPLPGLDLDAYALRLLQRFANPALQHQTRQFATDGSQKLPQRLLSTVRDRLHHGLSIERLALAVAAWIHCLSGVDEAGRAFEIHDPLAAALALQLALAEDAARRVLQERGSDADAEREDCTTATDHTDRTDRTDGAGRADRAERERIACFCSFAPVFGALGAEPRFVQAVARHTRSLRERGVLASLAAQEA